MVKFRYLELIAKISIFVYISLEIGYFELGDDYDVTVTSYLGCWYLFWYVWKEKTPGILWYQLDVWGGSFSSSPLVRRVAKNLGKTRVDACSFAFE